LDRFCALLLCLCTVLNSPTFTRCDHTLDRAQKITSHDAAVRDDFGRSVAVNGKHLSLWPSYDHDSDCKGRWLLLGDSTMGEQISGIFQLINGYPFCAPRFDSPLPIKTRKCEVSGDALRFPKLFAKCSVKSVKRGVEIQHTGARNVLVNVPNNMTIRYTFLGSTQNLEGLQNFDAHREIWELTTQYSPHFIVLGSGLHDAYCAWHPLKGLNKWWSQKLQNSFGKQECFRQSSSYDPCQHLLFDTRDDDWTSLFNAARIKFSANLDMVRTYLKRVKSTITGVRVLVKPNIHIPCNLTLVPYIGEWWLRRRIHVLLAQVYNKSWKSLCTKGNLCTYIKVTLSDTACLDGYRRDGFHFGYLRELGDTETCPSDTPSILSVASAIVKTACDASQQRSSKHGRDSSIGTSLYLR